MALDKRPGVRPVGIGETLRRTLAKRIIRAAGNQADTACGNLQLCAGPEAGIEGATHVVGQRILERLRARRGEEEPKRPDDEEETDNVAAVFDELNIDTEKTYEEEAEGIEAALTMDIEEEG